MIKAAITMGAIRVKKNNLTVITTVIKEVLKISQDWIKV